LPALIRKVCVAGDGEKYAAYQYFFCQQLGDNKFKDKLSTIFSIIDRTVPSSKVLQFCVEYGVESTNSKTRAASLEMLSQLIRKRGDIAPSASAHKLYRRIAEQISSADSNTRNYALDCIAFLHKYSGNAAFTYADGLPHKERDMLQNRIEKLAGPRSTPPSAQHSPQRQSGADPETSSPAQSQRKASTASGSVRVEPAERSSRSEQNARIVSQGHRPSPYEQESDARTRETFAVQEQLVKAINYNIRDRLMAAKTALPPPPYPEPEPDAQSPNPEIADSIAEADTQNPAECVKALKQLQADLVETPELFKGHVVTLITVLSKQFAKLFERQTTIDEPGMFRMAKHLIQTMSNFCDAPALLAEMDSDVFQNLLEQLTRGLLLLTKDEHKEMAKFVNMTILRLFATSNQIVLFK
jgi:cytoskeleton-associated protein 5